jgi:hypothetical protein
MRALRQLFPKALAIAVSFALVPAMAEAKSKTKTTTVECKDGTTSKAGRGACSHHGGVADTANEKSQEQTAKPAARATAASQGEAVECKDGTTSKAGRGACSHHGGVATNAKDEAREQPAAPEARDRETTAPQGRAAPRSERATSTPNAGQPTARCKDGTMSYAKQHSGACSHHGGVAEWLQ